MERILSGLSPSLSIEIGTHRGGSLQVIAAHSETVMSLDLDPQLSETLGKRFTNVEFVTGYSQQTLPTIVERLNTEKRSPEFVLIDGDHSERGVRDDVNLILHEYLLFELFHHDNKFFVNYHYHLIFLLLVKNQNYNL